MWIILGGKWNPKQAHVEKRGIPQKLSQNTKHSFLSKVIAVTYET